MEYRRLGNTGIKVSVISVGTLAFTDLAKEDDYCAIVKAAIDCGVNFIDTAEVYGGNLTEEMLGRIFKKINPQREELIVCTKLFIGKSPFIQEINNRGLSRKHIIEGMKNSLKRLQLEYVDVVLAHRPDPETPIEETCRAFNYLIDKGYAFYWGTSEWKTEDIATAFTICDKLGLIRPCVEQPQYNFFVRENVEKNLVRLYEENKTGTTCWGPLAGGLLTGKYNESIPEDSSFNRDPVIKVTYYDPYMSTEEKKKDTISKLQALDAIAKSLGIPMARLALAWVIKNPDVSTVMCGASKPEQYKDSVKAVEEAKLITPEIEAKIEEILKNKPAVDLNYRKFAPGECRRK